MDLKSFVKRTLADLTEAAEEAGLAVKRPTKIIAAKEGGGASDFDIGLVEFDVAVMARKNGGSKGDESITVCGGGLKGASQDASGPSVTRLRFSIYIGEGEDA